MTLKIECPLSLWCSTGVLTTSTCGKVSWLDMIWRGTHLFYEVPWLTVHVRAKTKPWSPRNFLETSETGQFQGTEPPLSGFRLFHFGTAVLRKLMKNPMVTLTELQCCSVERGKPSRSTTISVALNQSGQYGSNQTVKVKWQPTWDMPKSTWRTLIPRETKSSGLIK